MNIKVIGPLSVHPEEDDEWLVSEPIPVPYFDGDPMTFTIVGLDDDDDVAGVEAALDAFLALTPKDRQAAGRDLLTYYEKIAGRSAGEFDCSEENVWGFVQPAEIFVYAAHREEQAHVCILAECDWDVEHGLQISFKNGRELTKVSDQGDSYS